MYMYVYTWVYTYVTRKAKTDLMALENFDRPSSFNPLVHDDSLLYKFIIDATSRKPSFIIILLKMAA